MRRPGPAKDGQAALKIAYDMVDEGLISKEEAVFRIEPESLDQLLHPTLDPDAARDLLTRIARLARRGIRHDSVSADEAEAKAANGEAVVLVRIETSPEDIHGMHAAQGILTSRGGMTSHAAVVARGMGRPCVSGAGDLRIDYETQTLTVMGREIAAGDTLTIDGTSGEVMAGSVPTRSPNCRAISRPL